MRAVTAWSPAQSLPKFLTRFILLISTMTATLLPILVTRRGAAWSISILIATSLATGTFQYFSWRNPRRRDEPKKAKERYLTLRVNGVPLEKTRESLEDDLKSTAIPDPALLKPMITLSHISLVRLNKHSACATATFHTSFPSDELVRRLQAASNERGYPYKFDSGFYGITPLYEHEKDAYVE